MGVVWIGQYGGRDGQNQEIAGAHGRWPGTDQPAPPDQREAALPSDRDIRMRRTAPSVAHRIGRFMGKRRVVKGGGHAS